MISNIVNKHRDKGFFGDECARGNTKKRLRRHSKKRARQLLHKTMQETLQDELDMKAERLDQEDMEFIKFQENMEFMMAAELGRIAYEDEIIARLSEEDYPSGSIGRWHDEDPEEMSCEGYANYMCSRDIWD